MTIFNDLNSLDLDTPLGEMIQSTSEYLTFVNDIGFIQDTLSVLESDNLSHKKNFFLDNQSDVTDSLSNLHKLMDVFDDNSIDASNGDAGVAKLYQIIGITIKKLERGIEKFNQELTGQVSSTTVKEEVLVTEDTIKDAMQNNESTMQIARDLKNPRNTAIDPRTAQIQKDFQNLVNQKRTVQQQQSHKTQPKSNLITNGFLIASQDLSEFKIVSGIITKDALNQMIEKSGIDNARVFQLSELPTKQKTIQKTVTVVG